MNQVENGNENEISRHEHAVNLEQNLMSKMPKGRWCVKCKWVFKIKRIGIIYACLVACGYNKFQRFNSGQSCYISNPDFGVDCLASKK